MHADVYCTNAFVSSTNQSIDRPPKISNLCILVRQSFFTAATDCNRCRLQSERTTSSISPNCNNHFQVPAKFICFPRNELSNYFRYIWWRSEIEFIPSWIEIIKWSIKNTISLISLRRRKESGAGSSGYVRTDIIDNAFASPTRNRELKPDSNWPVWSGTLSITSRDEKCSIEFTFGRSLRHNFWNRKNA